MFKIFLGEACLMFLENSKQLNTRTTANLLSERPLQLAGWGSVPSTKSSAHA